MKLLVIVAYSLRRSLLRPMTAINLILLPLLLIVILGNALSSTFDAAEVEGEGEPVGVDVRIGVVDDDGTESSENIADFVDSASDAFEVLDYGTFAEAQTALRSDDVTVILVVGDGFGDDLSAGDPANVDLYAVDEHVDALRATQVVIDAYGDVVKATGLIVASTGAAPVPFEPGDFTPETVSVSAADPSAGVSGITYYAVTMLVLVLLYGVANTMNFVTEEYAGPLGDRYLATPTDKFSLALSQVIAGTVLTMIQATIIVMVAWLAFGADYGASPGGLAAIIGVAALFFNCIGLLLGMFARRVPALDSITTLAIPAMTFLGGGFVKVDLGGLEALSVNTVFQNLMFEQIAGLPVDRAALLGCAAVAVAAVGTAIVMLTRPEGR